MTLRLSEKFLVKGKPSCFGDFVQHVDDLWEPWSYLTTVTKTGKPFRMIEKDHGAEFFEKMVTQIFPMSYPCAKAAARELLSRVHRALKRGGKVLIAEIIADDERKKDVFPLIFAANMLVNSSDGNTFTMAQFREWLNEAGFSEVSIIEAPGPSKLIVAGK